MKISISGASGKTGYRIAEEAIKNRNQVNLILRKDSILPNTLTKCDKSIISLADNVGLDKALKNSDVLIIATGARPSIDLLGPAKVDAFGVRSQIESCKRVGLKRIVLVSSLCSGKLFHPLNLFGLILLWKRVGEEYLEKSSLDWTIIRPGGLTEKEENIMSEGIQYTGPGNQEEGSIPRRLVAKCCIEALETPTSIGKIIEVTSSDEIEKISMNHAINAFSIKTT